jgi:sodium/potassium/calcium exchanger 6
MHLGHLPSFSLLGALEFREVVASLRNQATTTSLSMFESPVTPYAGGHYHHHRARGVRSPSMALPPEADPWDASFSVPLDDRSPQQRGLLIHPSSPEGRGASAGEASHLPVPSVRRTPPSPTPSDTSDSSTYVPLTKRQRCMQNVVQVIHTLFPTLHHFRKQSLIGKTASLLAAPAVLALTLTLPVVVTPYESRFASREKLCGDDAPLVGFEEEGVQRVLIAEEEAQESIHEVKFNKWLMAVQCAIAPVFCVGVLFSRPTFFLTFADTH